MFCKTCQHYKRLRVTFCSPVSLEHCCSYSSNTKGQFSAIPKTIWELSDLSHLLSAKTSKHQAWILQEPQQAEIMLLYFLLTADVMDAHLQFKSRTFGIRERALAFFREPRSGLFSCVKLKPYSLCTH